MVSKKKRIHYSCEDGIEQSIHRDHCLSSIGKPRDHPIADPRDGFFYHILTLMIEYFIILRCVLELYKDMQ